MQHAKKAIPPEAASDGRVLRGERNHAAIVQAIYELVQATHLPPTVEEVARRAGVGTRTLFRQFEDLESLYQSLHDRLEGEIIALALPVEPSGQLEDDLRALIARRARIYEHMTPFRRAGRIARSTSAFLKDRDARATRVFRAMLVAVVGPHFPPALAARDGAQSIEVLDVLLSFEAWDRMRDQQGLSVDRAKRVLLNAALAIVDAAKRRESV